MISPRVATNSASRRNAHARVVIGTGSRTGSPTLRRRGAGAPGWGTTARGRAGDAVGVVPLAEVLRAIGESPESAHALGYRVRWLRLAAVVSGAAEADFDLGMRVNLLATEHLLDICRARGHRPKVVFTSSVAVYGGTLPARPDAIPQMYD